MSFSQVRSLRRGNTQSAFARPFEVARLITVALFLSLIGIASANAGEFFERDGVAIDGFDPVAYFTEAKAVKGNKTWHATYAESIFYFSSKEHRDLFVANPAQYAPQFNGFCAYGVSQGAKVKIEGERFAVVGGKLYLNYDESVQATWNEDREGYIKEAVENWPSLK